MLSVVIPDCCPALFLRFRFSPKLLLFARTRHDRGCFARDIYSGEFFDTASRAEHGDLLGNVAGTEAAMNWIVKREPSETLPWHPMSAILSFALAPGVVVRLRCPGG